MPDYKQIDTTDVITHFMNGKQIKVCILQSKHFKEGVSDLKCWELGEIAGLINEEKNNVVFYEKKED